jgi:uncharacterized protein
LTRRTRTKGVQTNTNDLKLMHQLQVLSEVINRAKLGSVLGESFGGDRKLYDALGYEKDLTYTNYYNQYIRQDIAKAIIDRPVATTWRGGVKIAEKDNGGETKLEQEWMLLNRELKLGSVFSRLDRLVSLGSYGVLLMGFNDVTDRKQFELPVSADGNRQLLYTKPLGEGSVDIIKWDEDPMSPRFGMPMIYEISLLDPKTSNSSTPQKLKVHHTRVVHVAGQLLENEVYGLPSLQAVFNRLQDLEKLTGGSAEMFWKGARPGYQGTILDDYELGTEEKDDLKAQIDEFEHNLRRLLINEGVELKSLAPQVSDPVNHVLVQLQMISAERRIPLRILIGSERGELASTEDRDNWFDTIQHRREEEAEPTIVRPFIDRCIEYGVLSDVRDEMNGYLIEWQDLWSPSDKERADVGKTRAEALRAYGQSSAMDIVPPEFFYREMLGMTDEEIELVVEMLEGMVRDEDDEFEEDEQGGADDGRRTRTS